MNDLVWIGPALLFGLIAARFGLPPMVGYLVGGFLLNAFANIDGPYLAKVGNLGVTLLLFTIGLKLDVRSLLKPVVWAGSTIHMLLVVVLFGFGLFGLGLTGLTIFADVNWKIAALIAFALSFSSTVFAVKTLEEKGEICSRHGTIAIGILIMQDIFAVVFLAFSAGEIPSLWALGLLLLIPLRRLLHTIMTDVGHGELQILLGLGLTYGAYGLFESVGVKGDLGALMLGAMLASHPSAGQLAKKLMGFKDLLLVGFFLSIGTSGDLTPAAFLVAVALAVAMAVKVFLYFLVLTRFRLRARTSVLASLSLANYSEFGLIVGSIALGNGWLSGDWLVTIALALTMTFIAAAPLNARSHSITASIRDWADRFQTAEPLPEDAPIDTGDALIGIIGMARVGTGAYDTLKARYGDVILGVDADPELVASHRAAGRNVLLADATDDDFWARVTRGKVSVGILAMHDYELNLGVARRIRKGSGRLFAIADHPEQEEALKALGVDQVWNFNEEAGRGFAEEVIKSIGDKV